MPEHKDQVLRFMLPDLLGKPKWGTTPEGNLVNFLGIKELPPDCYVFFISISEWKAMKAIPKGGKDGS